MFCCIFSNKSSKLLFLSPRESLERALNVEHYIMLQTDPSIPVTISGGGDSGGCFITGGGRMGVASTASRGWGSWRFGLTISFSAFLINTSEGLTWAGVQPATSATASSGNPLGSSACTWTVATEISSEILRQFCPVSVSCPELAFWRRTPFASVSSRIWL